MFHAASPFPQYRKSVEQAESAVNEPLMPLLIAIPLCFSLRLNVLIEPICDVSEDARFFDFVEDFVAHPFVELERLIRR